LILGGYEPEGYEDELAILPLIASQSSRQLESAFYQWQVNVTSFSLRLPDRTIPLLNNTPWITAVLDTGTPWIDVPNAKMLEYLDSEYDKQLDWVPCDMRQLDASLEIGFDGKLISVPFHNIIGPAYNTDTDNPVVMRNDTEGCSLRTLSISETGELGQRD
jgi:hypothetical protein